jgi:hypothetical protein
MSRQHADILVLYLSAPGRYGVRLQSAPALCVMPQPIAIEPAITSAEYDELTALRKARAWGTPLFQPGHAQYAAALTRLKQLETKELATSQPVCRTSCVHAH